MNNSGVGQKDKNTEKFVELANKRVNKAIKDLRLIGNLANRRNYTYTDVQAKKIIRILQKEVAALKVLFEGGSDNSGDEFRL